MQIHEVSLAKKKLITEDRTYLLWESVGRTLVEAQLTPAQIQQVFSQAEQGSTAAGNNRTSIGQVKDAGSAVASAWNDLKSKVQNSGPIRNIDAAYDQAAEKLKQATGGDAGVMKYVEKYRKFAKEHPIAQSFIYAALIAAAGISGAGAGGAAALGLLKMTDKLLQGEKFSSAAYSGAKTGAMAYAAGQVGKAMQGDQAQTVAPDNRPETGYGSKAWDDARDQLAQQKIAAAQDQTNVIRDFAGKMGLSGSQHSVSMVGNVPTRIDGIAVPPELYTQDQLNAINAARAIKNMTQQVRESQIRKAFYVASGLQTQLNEGVWDSIKGAAGKAAGAVGKYVQTKGHNLTTRITADKLMSAWKSAGSPTDSDAVADVMRNAGVDEQIITSVLAAVAKTRTGGRVAGQLSQTPNAIRKRQARAAKKVAPATTTATPPPATGGAGAFSQMAQQVTAPTEPATQTSSTGGTTQRTSTGLVHKANPNNPNLKVKESDKYVKRVAESWESYKLDEGIGSALGGLAGKGVGAIKNVGTAIASPFRDAAAGYRGGKVDAKTASIADKAYRSWSTYRQQLDKAAGGKADPATLEKQLLAFVSQNLLGGKQLSTLINKNQIVGLVKQIAGQPATATPPPVAKQAPAKTAPVTKGARMGKAPSATKTPVTKTTKTPATKPPTTPAGKTAPGAGAFGAMANQLGGTTGTTSTGGTATPTATGIKNKASATNPNQPAQSMADFTKQNPTAKYHEVTGEITPYGQQQADCGSRASG